MLSRPVNKARDVRVQLKAQISQSKLGQSLCIEISVGHGFLLSVGESRHNPHVYYRKEWMKNGTTLSLIHI